MEKELNINIENGIKELVVRQGEAMPVKEPIRVSVVANIDAVSRYLSKRSIEIDKCFIKVYRDDSRLSLIIDEHSPYSDNIEASLEVSKEVKMFSLNTGKLFTPFELADFIRMNRSYFQKSDEAAKLVMSLRNFKAKVNKEIENSNDNRGNRDIIKRQAVDSNLPESFKMEIPIFKGLDKCVVEVEVDIDADSLNCSLVSPMANELMQTLTNELIDEEIKAIIKIQPDLLILEC